VQLLDLQIRESAFGGLLAAAEQDGSVALRVGTPLDRAGDGTWLWRGATMHGSVRLGRPVLAGVVRLEAPIPRTSPTASRLDDGLLVREAPSENARVLGVVDCGVRSPCEVPATIGQPVDGWRTVEYDDGLISLRGWVTAPAGYESTACGRLAPAWALPDGLALLEGPDGEPLAHLTSALQGWPTGRWLDRWQATAVDTPWGPVPVWFDRREVEDPVDKWLELVAVGGQALWAPLDLECPRWEVESDDGSPHLPEHRAPGLRLTCTATGTVRYVTKYPGNTAMAFGGQAIQLHVPADAFGLPQGGEAGFLLADSGYQLRRDGPWTR
jgi:hypothetical protein